MDFDKILQFLGKISRNNNRDWFEKNKGTYLESKELFDQFLEELLVELARIDESLAGLNARKLAFRIYRDIRFSKDKKPYKVNMGAGFSSGGKMIQEPGFYLHIEPGNKSLLAGGLYMPDPQRLASLRQEIDYNSAAFLQILRNRKFRKMFPELDDFDKLKTTPKGYPKDHPQIEYLKLKSFLVSRNFTDKEVRSPQFLRKLVETAKIIAPFNTFLKEAIA